MACQPENHKNKLIFVNAPKLSRNSSVDSGFPEIRSMVIRQQMRKKKAASARQLRADKRHYEMFLNPAIFLQRGKPTSEKHSETLKQSLIGPYRDSAIENEDKKAVEMEAFDMEAFSHVSLASPRSLLSAARSDPFSHWYIELDSYGHEVLDFCVREFWPSLRSPEYATICYRSRFHRPSKLLMYSVLWATAVHLDFNRGVPSGPKQNESSECLRYFDLTLQALRGQMKGATPATILDEALLSILYIAVNYKVRARLVRDPSPFDAPQRGLHHLDIFGTTTFHATHWKVLNDLIQARGGIRTIQLATLPWLLTMADLLHAVGSLNKPIYPLLNLVGEPMQYPSPCRALKVALVQFPHYYSNNGGFHQLKSLLPPVRQTIVEACLGIREYSQYLDAVQLDQRALCTTHGLGDFRDIVHHRFMSLPDENDLNDVIMDVPRYTPASSVTCQSTRSIYFMIRSAIFLYITHVTFPLPRGLALRKRLLAEILSYFTPPDSIPHGTPLELFLWPAAIAAIAAKDERCRAQFVGIMQTLCQKTGISNFDDFRRTMQSFAWVNCACDREGYVAWADSQKVSG